MSIKHLIINASGLEDDVEICINSVVRQKFLNAIQNSGAKIVKVDEHEFEPYGYTCVVVLAESHAILHTYPEYNAIYVDFFACGDVDFDEFITSIIREFKPSQMHYQIFERAI